MFHKIRSIISLAAGILIGLIFIASGTGKLLSDIETPAQVMAFINDILPEFLLTPPVMFFIYDVLVPYLFPIAELVLGICLLIGLVPALLSGPCPLAWLVPSWFIHGIFGSLFAGQLLNQLFTGRCSVFRSRTQRRSFQINSST